MKLYLNPRSGASRSILMFYHEHERMAAMYEVALASPQKAADRPAADGRRGTAPMLLDGDLVLSHSAAILRYLADRCGSSTYPASKRPRARVDAALDWIHSALATDLCRSDRDPGLLSRVGEKCDRTREARRSIQAMGRLEQFDTHLREERCPYLCGDQISLADYLAAGLIGDAKAYGLGLGDWPRLTSWLRLMRSRPGWAPAHFAVRVPDPRRWLSSSARAA